MESFQSICTELVTKSDHFRKWRWMKSGKIAILFTHMYTYAQILYITHKNMHEYTHGNYGSQKYTFHF